MDPTKTKISRITRLVHNRVQIDRKRIKEVEDALASLTKSGIYGGFYISSYLKDPVEIWFDQSQDLEKIYTNHFANSKIKFFLRHFEIE